MSGDFQIAHPLIKAAEAAEANRLPPELILGAEVIALVLENATFLSFYTLMAKNLLPSMENCIRSFLTQASLFLLSFQSHMLDSSGFSS